MPAKAKGGALADMRSADAAAAGAAVLVVPLGATEQHGPHLPLTTDTEIAVALAQRLARAEQGVAIAPPLPFGASGEHQSFAGTLSIGTAATETVLVELGRSATETWRRVLLLCAHGGDADAVRGALARLRAEGRDVRAWSPSWGGDAHAGHVETSIMLALDPARVDLAAAPVGATAPVERLLPAMRAGGVAAVSPSGVLGDATTASAAAGEALLAGATRALAAFVRGWEPR